MTQPNPIAAILAAPLAADWTIEQLAEDILTAIANQSLDRTSPVSLDAATITDRQSLRLFRPLLACLASMAALESATPPNIFDGQLSFMRAGRNGWVLISGSFQNLPSDQYISLGLLPLPNKDVLPWAKVVQPT